MLVRAEDVCTIRMICGKVSDSIAIGALIDHKELFETDSVQ